MSLRGEVPVINSESPRHYPPLADRYSPTAGYYGYSQPVPVAGMGMNKFRGSIAPIQTLLDYGQPPVLGFPPGLYMPPEKNKQVDVPIAHSLSPRKELNSGFILQAPNTQEQDLLTSNKNVIGYLRQPQGLSFTGGFFPGPGLTTQRTEVASSKNSPKHIEYRKYYSPTQKHRTDNYSRLVHQKVINLRPEGDPSGGNAQSG